MFTENKETVNNKIEKEQISKYVFLLGGNDLEMEQIKKRLNEAGIKFIDKELQWGAEASQYKEEIAEIAGDNKIPVLVELSTASQTDAFELPNDTILIDHHGEDSQKESSIIQVLKLINIEPQKEDRIVGMNDVSGVYGLIDSKKFSREEILDVRRKDWAAQGITPEIVKQSEEASKNVEIDHNLSLAIIKLPHTKFGPTKDYLALDQNIRQVISIGQKEKNGKYEVEFQGYDHGDIGKQIFEEIGKGSWSGGTGYNQKRGPYYVGGYVDDPEDFINFIKKQLTQLKKGRELPIYNSFEKSKKSERDPKFDDLVNQILSQEPGDKKLPIELKSPEGAKEASHLSANILEWIRELGLDAEKRLPKSEKIHFICPVPMRYERVLCNPDAEAVSHPLKKTSYIVIRGSKEDIYHGLNHELVHNFSRASVLLGQKEAEQRSWKTLGRKTKKRTPDAKLIRSGYANTKTEAFKYFNEFVTEAINIETLNKYRNETGKDYLSKSLSSEYLSGVVVFDLIIKMIGRKTGRTKKEIKNDFYRGYFTGDTTVLKETASILGRQFMKNLAFSKADTNINDLFENVSGCEDLVKKSIQNLSSLKIKKSDGIDLLDGIRIRRKG